MLSSLLTTCKPDDDAMGICSNNDRQHKKQQHRQQKKQQAHQKVEEEEEMLPGIPYTKNHHSISNSCSNTNKLWRVFSPFRNNANNKKNTTRTNKLSAGSVVSGCGDYIYATTSPTNSSIGIFDDDNDTLSTMSASSFSPGPPSLKSSCSSSLSSCSSYNKNQHQRSLSNSQSRPSGKDVDAGTTEVGNIAHQRRSSSSVTFSNTHEVVEFVSDVTKQQKGMLWYSPQELTNIKRRSTCQQQQQQQQDQHDRDDLDRDLDVGEDDDLHRYCNSCPSMSASSSSSSPLLPPPPDEDDGGGDARSLPPSLLIPSLLPSPAILSSSMLPFYNHQLHKNGSPRVTFHTRKRHSDVHQKRTHHRHRETADANHILEYDCVMDDDHLADLCEILSCSKNEYEVLANGTNHEL